MDSFGQPTVSFVKMGEVAKQSEVRIETIRCSPVLVTILPPTTHDMTHQSWLQ